MGHEFPSSLAIIGMGYVGLPLAIAFGKLLPTVGFDIDVSRVKELEKGYDRNAEATAQSLMATHLTFSHDVNDLAKADLFIVAVPTPLGKNNIPDLSLLRNASRLVGQALKFTEPTPSISHIPVIVYESTVYPGCTEEICVPILEQESGLKVGKEFKIGYSPERINPGDPKHTLSNVVKVVAAQDLETTEQIANVYGMVVEAGVYKAPNIPTAEAAKVIENVQRDLNIALANELAMLFHALGIDTKEVLKAAGTKWNFLPFQPGLVGGHCIPVDPYYLTHKAQQVGYYPEVILAGRRINDQMGIYLAKEIMKLLTQSGRNIEESKILVLGATFKEDVRDTRNTKVVDLVLQLQSYGAIVEVHDPMLDNEQLLSLGLRPAKGFLGSHPRAMDVYNAVVLAVPHQVFLEMSKETYKGLLYNENGPGILMDIKGALPWGQDDSNDLIYATL